ncbi:DUF2946 domain-containing protein [Pollutimonas harenae]|uniref:DUF2946 domain-containing protein n=1 Tax=Pollutimonas harenae TaxID=657015 RepID=A0A853H4R6_9BURK|nr:DUF2946 domain-containing protein [Pollutimonas harenae]NYT87010.1 DUF2946 domain-containing protein [Pollutimonas harenae]TEA69230.1 DUF2946 domain-containing protein [Pollutimonas harenae]
MKISLRTHRRAGWIALIAFLLTTLMPSIALAVSNDTAAQAVWVQLCTVNGPTAIQIDTAAEADPLDLDSTSTQSGHCVLCFHPACPPRVGLSAVADFDGLHFAKPSLFYLAPSQLFAWAVSLARAPPRAI